MLPELHPERQIPGEPPSTLRSIVYLIDEKQLTKDWRGSEGVMCGLVRNPQKGKSGTGRKTFSHVQREFPSCFGLNSGGCERTQELQSDQIVAFARVAPQHAGMQVSGHVRQISQSANGSARYL